MVPRQDEFLSFLVAAPAIADEELTAIGIDIVERFGSGIRGLAIPQRSLEPYRSLIRRKLERGFWNETVGRREIYFQFKLADGTLEELEYSATTEREISRLCSELNQDPVEKTSDIRRYLAGNSFYRELIVRFHST